MDIGPSSTQTRPPPARHVQRTHVTIPLPENLPIAFTLRPEITYQTLGSDHENHIPDHFSPEFNTSDLKVSEPQTNVLASIERDQQKEPLVEPSVMAAVIPVVTLLAIIPVVAIGVWLVRRSWIRKHNNGILVRIGIEELKMTTKTFNEGMICLS